MKRHCGCTCGCDYRIDDYAPTEWACGACVSVCGQWGIQYPLPTENGERWEVETFDTERDAVFAAARVMNTTGAEYVTLQEKRGGVWQEPHETFTREAWDEYSREQAD